MCWNGYVCFFVSLSFLFVYWLLMDFFFILDLIVKNKEEELNLIIVELRKSLASLQEKLSKEESEKLVRKSRWKLWYPSPIRYWSVNYLSWFFFFSGFSRLQWILLQERKRPDLPLKSHKLPSLKSSERFKESFKMRIKG